MSLLDCAPCMLSCLLAYAPYPSLIRALRAFALPCLITIERYLCFYVCVSINHSLLVSFVSPYKAVLHTFFHSFILSHWLLCYLYNYFATTFSDFLFSFSFEINLTNIPIFTQHVVRYCKNC